MKYILSFLIIFFLNNTSVVLANGDDPSHAHASPEKRSGEVSPAAIAIFGAAVVGAGGYFVWLKLKQGKEPPKQDPQAKT